MRRLAAIFACIAALVWHDAAEARGAAQLRFEQRAPHDRCPDEAELRRRVQAQLGYDPFDAGASTRVEATIEHEAPLFHGRVRILREGTIAGERELDPTKDCDALVSALALTISVAIDPIGPSGPSGASPTAAPAAPSVPAAAVAPAPESRPRDEGRVDPPTGPVERRAEPSPTDATGPSLRLTAAPIVSVGIAPAVAPGVSASVGAGWRRLSLALEGRLDLPASARLSIGGEVDTSVALASFVPCVHVTRWIGCALASVGSMRAESSGISAPAIDYSVFAAVGVRVGIELPVSNTFALRPQIDGQAALTRPSLELNGRSIWTTPPIAGSLGVALIARLGRNAPL